MNVLNIVPMPPPPPSSRSREPHVTVLKREVVDAIAPQPGNLYVDATVGAGGHSRAILDVPGTRLLGIDRDGSALSLAATRLARFGDRARLVRGRFSQLERLVAEAGLGAPAGVVADLGVSSMQIDEAARGMSFRLEGPLDMRMDPESGDTALGLIDRFTDDELADVLYKLGDERRSRRVARCIKQAREAGELSTTHDLRRAVVRAVGPARIGGVDPATRTFQALRIAVNAELDELSALLDAASRVLPEGGVVAVVSFHSLEDRIVKRAMRAGPWSPLTKKPVVPSDDEVADNPRARSAKLRAAWRVDGAAPRLCLVDEESSS